MLFVLFGCIWDCLVAFQYSVQNGSNWCKSSCHEVALEFFATNAPDPPHWTLNSCFGLFSTIWVHLGLFGCLTKLGAKRDRTSAKVHATKSHQNFSQLKHPDLPHWTINSHFGVFRTIQVHLGPFWLPYNTQYKTGQTGAIVHATKSCWNFSQ